MSAFKDQVATDISNVFINMDEFADEHELNGETMPCVVETMTEQEMFQKGIAYNGYEDVHGAVVTVYVEKDRFREVPTESEIITLDGRIGEVSSCADDMGVLAITIHFNHA